MNTTHISTTVSPTQVGQRVRATTYGGNVRLYMAGTEGTVVRFAKTGAPVVEIDHRAHPYTPGKVLIKGNCLASAQVVDTWGCFKVLSDEGKLVWS